MRGARPGPQLLALLRPQSPMAAAALKVPPEVAVAAEWLPDHEEDSHRPGTMT